MRLDFANLLIILLIKTKTLFNVRKKSTKSLLKSQKSLRWRLLFLFRFDQLVNVFRFRISRKIYRVKKIYFCCNESNVFKINNRIEKTKIDDLRSTRLIVEIKIIFLCWMITRLACIIAKLHTNWYISRFFLSKMLIDLFSKFEINIVLTIFCNASIVVYCMRKSIVIATFWTISRTKRLKSLKKIKQISLFW